MGDGRSPGADPAPSLPVFGLVPARGGSKGLPGKNLKRLGDRSLLERAIDSGSGADISEVFVTSDDPAILRAAEEAGATPIGRPDDLATDDTPMEPVLAHAIEWIGRERDAIDFDLVLLQPTSPLRTAQHVDAALALGRETGAAAVVSVVVPDRHPLKAMVRGEDGRLTGAFSADAPYQNRQSLPDAVFPNGAIYVFRASSFREEGQIPRQDVVGMEMSATDSIDIDSEADLIRARTLITP